MLLIAPIGSLQCLLPVSILSCRASLRANAHERAHAHSLYLSFHTHARPGVLHPFWMAARYHLAASRVSFFTPLMPFERIKPSSVMSAKYRMAVCVP